MFNYYCDEVKRIIEEVSPNYPQLSTYEKEWIYFYENEYTPGTPVELEYETVIINPTGSISNAIPYNYKSAILKGQTLVNLLSESNVNVKSSNTYRINYAHDLNTTKTYILQYRINQIPELSDTTDSARLLKFEWYNGTKLGGYSDIFFKDITVGTNNFIIINPFSDEIAKTFFAIWCPNYVSGSLDMDIILIEYHDGMENWDIPYFEGIQSVRMPVLTTNGSNLIPPFTEWSILSGSKSDYSIIDKRVEISLSRWNMGVSITKQLKPNTTYTVGWDEVSRVTFNFSGTDKSGDLSPFRTFTTGNTGIVTFTLKNSMSSGTFIIDGFRINEGNSDLGYKPYKSNILTVNEEVELRGIDEVKDELDLTTGEVTERIGEIVLDGSDDEDWIIDLFEYSGIKYLRFMSPLDNVKKGGFGLCDKLPSLKGDVFNTDYVRPSTNRIWVYKKDLTLTLQGFINELKNNPITIQYELETESIKTVDLTPLNKPYEGTNHYHLTANIPCEAILKVPVVSTGEQTLEEINN